MNNSITIGLAALAMSWSAVSAATYDGSKPLLCASMEIIECLPVDGCQRVATEEIDAPQFMKLDFKAKKMVTTASQGKSKTSAIERSEQVDGKLMLQGAEDGVEGVRDGLGWTMSISQQTGKMVVSASGDDAAFVIFGACTAL